MRPENKRDHRWRQSVKPQRTELTFTVLPDRSMSWRVSGPPCDRDRPGYTELPIMEYRVFPATGDRLSALGFGAMGFAGWFGPVDDGEAIRALHTSLDLGVN